MKINLPAIHPRLEFVYELVCKQVSQGMGYTVRWIDRASLLLQNRFLAGAALVVANIAFFEIARVICYVVHRIFEHYASYANLSESSAYLRNLSIGVIFVGVVAGANWAFCKVFRLSLPIWVVAAISCITCLVYLQIKLILKTPQAHST